MKKGRRTAALTPKDAITTPGEKGSALPAAVPTGRRKTFRFRERDDDMDDIKTMSIDLETRSGVDITKAGVYKYAQSPDFDILLFGYSVDGGEVQVIDLKQRAGHSI